MTITKQGLFITVVALLTSCGGGGGSSLAVPDPVIPPVAGISRTGIAAGVIDNFGSVFVNGVRYETTNANITVNGLPATETDLKVGQYVVIKGTIDDDLMEGEAENIKYNDNVTGPVQSIDVAAGTLVVLGQTVVVSNTTSFDDSIPGQNSGGLAPGNIVEVSGIVDADGRINATRIELKTQAGDFEVVGVVSNHDAGAQTFSINNLVVDYGNAMLEDFTDGMITNGQVVEAKGDSFGADGELLADTVELESPDDLIGDDGDHAEIDGFITQFVSATDFHVSGVPVTTNASTVFEGGSAADLAVNVEVEVEGDFDANGVLVATKVEFEREDSVEITATVDSVNASANQLVILDVTVTVTAGTRFEDKSDADVDPLTLADINAGDYLEIKGIEDPAGSGNVTAALVEREDPDPDVELQGFVTAVSDPVLTVLGVTIDTTGAEFRDANDLPLSRTEFFGRVSTGTLIKAKGTETATAQISAEEVELESGN